MFYLKISQKGNVMHLRLFLKELCHDIWSHFLDGLNYGLSVGKGKKKNWLRKKNTKWVILKQKGTRMAEDG